MALSKIINSGIGAIDTLAVDTDTLVVDSTNNRVGIGTTSPVRNLDIASAGATTASIRSTGTSAAVLYIQNSDTGTGDSDGIYLGRSAAVNYLWTYENEPWVFGTNNSERLRIDSSGNLLVDCTALPSGGAGGAGFEAGASNARTILQLGTTSTAAGNTVARFYNPNGAVGDITMSGSSTAYNTSSDYRLKENVTADWDATTRLKQLNPVRFNFISDADTTVDGFLAHEVQSVVPEAITGTHNEVDADGNPVYQGIDQSKLVPLLVKTIQELEARIVTLENA